MRTFITILLIVFAVLATFLFLWAVGTFVSWEFFWPGEWLLGTRVLVLLASVYAGFLMVLSRI